MGTYSCIKIGYGFPIPDEHFDAFLKKDLNKKSYEYGEYVEDGIYTHRLGPDTFVYGKIIYCKDDYTYFEEGNREVLDLNKILKISMLHKTKIDRMAKKFRTKATFFGIALIG